MAARNDPNAPQLILAPIDDDVIMGEYQLASPWGTDSYPEEGGESGLLVKQPKTGEPAADAPKDPNEQPYRNDPTPAVEVEKRFQELLKQYNITSD